MIELSLAYLVGAGLIAGLFFMAKQNQKQGWRKHRAVWGQATLTAFETQPEPPQTLSHLGDLGRLQQSLVAHGKPQSPENVPEKTSDLQPLC